MKINQLKKIRYRNENLHYLYHMQMRYMQCQNKLKQYICSCDMSRGRSCIAKRHSCLIKILISRRESKHNEHLITKAVNLIY